MGQVGVAGNLDFTRIRSFDPKNKNANAIPTLKPIPSFNKSDPSYVQSITLHKSFICTFGKL